jgi:hypothetical protein
LEEVKKAAALSPEHIPAEYAERYWRKKQESQTAWYEKDNRKRLINWPQQLENWWIEDKAKWEEKKGGGTTVVDLEAELHRETDPERRRQLKEQIERRNK